MKKVYLILVAFIVFFGACSNAKSEESVSESDMNNGKFIDKSSATTAEMRLIRQ